MSLRDSQNGYLGDLGEILGEMHSGGDSIVREALSTFGTHLSLTTNNAPYIPQDSLFMLQLATDSTNTMWRKAEADEVESLVTKCVDTTMKKCRGVVQCETRLEVMGDTQSAVTVSVMGGDMSIHSTVVLQQIDYLMLSKYKSAQDYIRTSKDY